MPNRRPGCDWLREFGREWRGSNRAGDVLETPRGKRADGATKIAAFVGQTVLESPRVLAVGGAGDEALTFEAFESVGEDVGGDVLGGGEELRIASFSAQEVAHQQEGPSIADDVEGAGDRAV